MCFLPLECFEPLCFDPLCFDALFFDPLFCFSAYNFVKLALFESLASRLSFCSFIGVYTFLLGFESLRFIMTGFFGLEFTDSFA